MRELWDDDIELFLDAQKYSFILRDIFNVLVKIINSIKRINGVDDFYLFNRILVNSWSLYRYSKKYRTCIFACAHEFYSQHFAAFIFSFIFEVKTVVHMFNLRLWFHHRQNNIKSGNIAHTYWEENFYIFLILIRMCLFT